MPKPEKKLIDIAKFVRSAGNKTRRFIDQKILAASKAMLLIGGDTNPTFREKFVNLCKSSWKIAGISKNHFQCDIHIPISHLSQQHVTTVEHEVQQFHKLYESVVMLPQKNKTHRSIADEDFLTDFFPSSGLNKIELSLLTFRMASRVLTSSGVVVLSSSASSFFQQKGILTSQQCLDDQSSCVNLHIGERDYTDIDSNCLSVLCEQLELEHPDTEQDAVLELYKNWVEGRGLPFPGSFAKLLKKGDVIYPQFY